MGNARLGRINLRVLAIIAVIAIMATAAYGFAASNTFTDGAGYAGDGSGTVSGFTITNVQWTLAADPSILASVSFQTDNNAGTVKASLNDGGSWSSCTQTTNAKHWSCAFSGSPSVASTADLRVVAVQ